MSIVRIVCLPELGFNLLGEEARSLCATQSIEMVFQWEFCDWCDTASIVLGLPMRGCSNIQIAKDDLRIPEESHGLNSKFAEYPFCPLYHDSIWDALFPKVKI